MPMIAAALFLMWEEFFRLALRVIVGFISNQALVLAELVFWIGREVVWWWLVAGLAAIALSYVRRLPLVQESIVRCGRYSAPQSQHPR